MYLKQGSASRNTYELPKDIPAIPLIPTANSPARFGAIMKLPVGSAIELCEFDYDRGTVRVRLANQRYLVFLQDLDPVEMRTAAVTA
jgi:hypothetical protein